MFFDFEQHKYLYLIHKESSGPSVFEAWNKNVFCLVGRWNIFSSNPCGWYKNVCLNFHSASQFSSYGLLAELRKI